MKRFTYTVGAENGVHARPAGVLVNAARSFSSEVTVSKPGARREADCKQLFSVMSLGARKGEELTFVIQGNDEDSAARTLEQVCRETLG